MQARATTTCAKIRCDDLRDGSNRGAAGRARNGMDQPLAALLSAERHAQADHHGFVRGR